MTVSLAIKNIRATGSKPDRYLTCKEAMGLLNVSRPTLISHTKLGNLKSYRFGKRIMYNERELIAGNSLFQKIIRKKNSDRKPIAVNFCIPTSRKESTTGNGK